MSIREAGSKVPQTHPDIDHALRHYNSRRNFREALGLDDSKSRGAELTRVLEPSDRLASELQSSLKQLAKDANDESKRKANAAFIAAGKNCVACHVKHTDS
jgi:hypothetical protein